MGHQGAVCGIKGLWFWEDGHCVWDSRSLDLGGTVSSYGTALYVPIYGIFLTLFFVWPECWVT